MFANTRAFSGFAVDDIEAAKKFYGEALGLRTSEQYGLLTLHLAGDRDTLVYPKPDHVPASYTILNFGVDDIDAIIVLGVVVVDVEFDFGAEIEIVGEFDVEGNDDFAISTTNFARQRSANRALRMSS